MAFLHLPLLWAAIAALVGFLIIWQGKKLEAAILGQIALYATILTVFSAFFPTTSSLNVFSVARRWLLYVLLYCSILSLIIRRETKQNIKRGLVLATILSLLELSGI